MTPSEHLYPDFETQPEAITDIRTRCLADVYQELGYAQSQFESGDEIEHDQNDVAKVLAEIAQASALSGDIAQVDACIYMISKCHITHPLPMVRACFAGLKSGSVYAEGTLRQGLEGEAAYLQSTLPENPPYGARKNLQHYNDEVLGSVVAFCGAEGLPADAWIEQYAVGPARRWHHYAVHYATMARQSEGAAEVYEERIHQKVTELLDTTTYSPRFVLEQMGTLLPHVNDLGLRNALARKLAECTSFNGFDKYAHGGLIDSSIAFLQGELAVDADVIDLLDQKIEAAEQELIDETSPVDLATLRLKWEAAKAQHQGMSPADLISYINREISQRAIDYPNDEQKITYGSKYGLTQQYARYYTDREDFASAGLFAYNIAASRFGHVVYRECLNKATTPEQIAALKAPVTKQLETDNMLRWQFAIAEEILKGDSNLEQLALQCAHQAGREYILQDYAKKAFEVVCERDPSRTVPLARMMIKTIDATGETSFFTEPYRDALLKVGDTYQATKEFQRIDREESSNVEAFVFKWFLAKKLPSSRRTLLPLAYLEIETQ